MKNKLNLPKNFLSNLADAEVAFAKSKVMEIGGRIYTVEFEQLKDEKSGEILVGARAFLNGIPVMATPWQSSEDAQLSAVFALRTALESIGRTMLKPKAGDIARIFLAEGKFTDAVISGYADETHQQILVAQNGMTILDDGKLIFKDASFSKVDALRVHQTDYFQTLKVWKYRYTSTEGTELDFKVSKPLWMVY